MCQRHSVPGWGFLTSCLEVMGVHSRFLSKVRAETHGKVFMEQAPLQMGQGWSTVEGVGGRRATC